MMKRTLTLALCLIAGLTAMAAHVTPTQAEQAARAFLNKQSVQPKGKGLRLARRQALSMTGTQDRTAFYVFNVGQDEGFVMVSGDDRTPPILGYAEQGQYVQERVPDNMKAWLDNVARQLAWLDATDGSYERPRLHVDREPVSPMLKTTWNQGGPYNNRCPVDPSTGQRSVTGCAATALAQVLNYHRYPSQTVAPIPAYTTHSRSISMPEIPATAIDWDNMCNSYGGTESEAQANAVAQLMLLCGQGIEMDYTSGGSGAMSIPLVTTLQRHFGYDRTTRILSRNHYSADDWDELLYGEMAAGRPVLYGAQSTGGGHEFVIDGYSSDGMFHVNWGWGGSDDGYFLISVLNPHSTDGIGSSSTDDGYSFEQDAVVGIQHSTGEVAPELFTVNKCSAPTTTYTRSSASANFTGVTVTTGFYNMSGVTGREMMLAMVLHDEDDQPATDNALLKGVNAGDLDTYWGVSAYNFSLDFGASLPDGIYYLVPYATSNGLDEWLPAYGSNTCRVRAEIGGNTLTLTNPTVALSAVIATEGKLEAAHNLMLKAAITNEGTRFNGYVYLLVNGEQKGARSFEAGEGETRNFEIDFTPKSSGTTTVSLAYDSNGNLITFATTTINVGAAAAGRTLTGSYNVVGAKTGVVADSEVEIQVSVSNSGQTDFDNVVKTTIWKYEPSDGYYHSANSASRNLTLAAGQSTTLSFAFNNLANHASYLVTFSYVDGGAFKEIGKRTSFATDYVEQTTQTLQLAEGWNWVSGYLQEPLGLSELSAKSSRILSQEAELIRDPEYGMVGNLTTMEAGKAYKVQATAPFSPTFSGVACDPTAQPLQLQAGWNWIAYPVQVGGALATVVPTADEGDRLVGQSGFAEYAGGNWEGSLATLTPGAGYLYKSVSAKQLFFAVPASAARQTDGTAREAELLTALARRYPSTMNITARICQEDSELTCQADYRIVALSGDDVRGVSQQVGANHYLTVYGEEPAAISFRIEHIATGQMWTATQQLNFADDIVGSRGNPFVLSIPVTTGIASQTIGTTGADVYSVEGVLVGRTTDAARLKQLPRGLYILGGKKYVSR